MNNPPSERGYAILADSLSWRLAFFVCVIERHTTGWPYPVLGDEILAPARPNCDARAPSVA